MAKMTRVMMHHKPTFMSVNLVAAEAAVKAVKQFMEKVNKKFEGKSISTSTSQKFAKARKLDVSRAVILKEGDLDNIEPISDPLRTEPETGKFTILPGPDTSGVAIPLFTANLHNPKKVLHRTMSQGVIYQLGTALRSIEPQSVRHSTISSIRNYSTGIDDKTSHRNTESLLIKISTEMNNLSKGFDKLEGRLEKLEERFGKLEETVEGRLEKLEERFGKLEEKVTELSVKMDVLSEQEKRNFTQILFLNRTIVFTAMGSITLAGGIIVFDILFKEMVI